MPANVEATPALPGLSPVCGKPIISRFDGGKLSSDGGVVALREFVARLRIANRLAACVADTRGHNHQPSASPAKLISRGVINNPG